MKTALDCWGFFVGHFAELMCDVTDPADCLNKALYNCVIFKLV